ncbi:MAG: hypothetical protein U0790_16360 [Isosphaeraceae bacterium]
MRRPRLTLAGSLGIVAVLALGMAGLRSATTFWTSAAATLTLGLLLGAVLGAFLLAGPERAACLGFAVFGFVYLVLVGWDWVGGQFGHDLTAGLRDLAEWFVPSPVGPTRANPSGTPAFMTPAADMAAHATRIGNFVEIARMVLALLFGAAGGWIAVWFSRHGQAAARDGRD